jgi:hypothetical protein
VAVDIYHLRSCPLLFVWSEVFQLGASKKHQVLSAVFRCGAHFLACSRLFETEQKNVHFEEHVLWALRWPKMSHLMTDASMAMVQWWQCVRPRLFSFVTRG